MDELRNLLLNPPTNMQCSFSCHTKSTFLLTVKQHQSHTEVTLDYRSMSQRPKLEALFVAELTMIYKLIMGHDPELTYMDPPIVHPHCL